MAKFKKNKILSGAIGPYVFRELNDEQLMQGKPKHIKQTMATKKSASEFGKCSQWAKNLRIGLTPLLVGLTDSTFHSRFSTAVYNAVRNNTALSREVRNPLNSPMDSLKGFEFNTHSPFKTYCKTTILAEINTNKEVVIQLPEFDPLTKMEFPKGCTMAKLVCFVYATDFKETTNPLVFHSIAAINQNRIVPAQELLHTSPIPDGYFVMAAVKLLYYNANLLTESNYLNTKDFSPAMVVLAEAVGL